MTLCRAVPGPDGAVRRQSWTSTRSSTGLWAERRTSSPLFIGDDEPTMAIWANGTGVIGMQQCNSATLTRLCTMGFIISTIRSYNYL